MQMKKLCPLAAFSTALLLGSTALASPFLFMPDMVPVWRTKAIPAGMPGEGSLSLQFVQALNRAYPIPFLDQVQFGFIRSVYDEQGKPVGDSLSYYQEAYVCGSDLHAQTVRKEGGGYVFAIALRGQEHDATCYSSALIFDYDLTAGALVPRPEHPWLGESASYFPAGNGNFFRHIDDDGSLRLTASGSTGILSYINLGYAWNGRDYVLQNGSLSLRKSAVSSAIEELKPDHMALYDIDGDGYKELFLYSSSGSAMAVAGLRGPSSSQGFPPDAESFFILSAPEHGFELRKGMLILRSGGSGTYSEEKVRLQKSRIFSRCQIFRQAAPLPHSGADAVTDPASSHAGSNAPLSGSAVTEERATEVTDADPQQCRDMDRQNSMAEPVRTELDWIPLKEIRIR